MIGKRDCVSLIHHWPGCKQQESDVRSFKERVFFLANSFLFDKNREREREISRVACVLP